MSWLVRWRVVRGPLGERDAWHDIVAVGEEVEFELYLDPARATEAQRLRSQQPSAWREAPSGRLEWPSARPDVLPRQGRGLLRFRRVLSPGHPVTEPQPVVALFNGTPASMAPRWTARRPTRHRPEDAPFPAIHRLRLPLRVVALPLSAGTQQIASIHTEPGRALLQRFDPRREPSPARATATVRHLGRRATVTAAEMERRELAELRRTWRQANEARWSRARAERRRRLAQAGLPADAPGYFLFDELSEEAVQSQLTMEERAQYLQAFDDMLHVTPHVPPDRIPIVVRDRDLPLRSLGGSIHWEVRSRPGRVLLVPRLSTRALVEPAERARAERSFPTYRFAHGHVLKVKLTEQSQPVLVRSEDLQSEMILAHLWELGEVLVFDVLPWVLPLEGLLLRGLTAGCRLVGRELFRGVAAALRVVGAELRTQRRLVEVARLFGITSRGRLMRPVAAAAWRRALAPGARAAGGEASLLESRTTRAAIERTPPARGASARARGTVRASEGAGASSEGATARSARHGGAGRAQAGGGQTPPDGGGGGAARRERAMATGGESAAAGVAAQRAGVAGAAPALTPGEVTVADDLLELAGDPRMQASMLDEVLADEQRLWHVQTSLERLLASRGSPATRRALGQRLARRLEHHLANVDGVTHEQRRAAVRAFLAAMRAEGPPERVAVRAVREYIAALQQRETRAAAGTALSRAARSRPPVAGAEPRPSLQRSPAERSVQAQPDPASLRVRRGLWPRPRAGPRGMHPAARRSGMTSRGARYPSLRRAWRRTSGSSRDHWINVVRPRIVHWLGEVDLTNAAGVSLSRLSAAERRELRGRILRLVRRWLIRTRASRARMLQPEQVRRILLATSDVLDRHPFLARDEGTVRSLMLLLADTRTSASVTGVRAAAGELRTLLDFGRRRSATRMWLLPTHPSWRTPDMVMDFGGGRLRLEVTTVIHLGRGDVARDRLWAAIERKAFPRAPGGQTQLTSVIGTDPALARRGTVSIFVPFHQGENMATLVEQVVREHSPRLLQARGLDVVEIYVGGESNPIRFTRRQIAEMASQAVSR